MIQRVAGVVGIVLSCAGCSLLGGKQVNPADVALGVACLNQVQTVVATARQQISSCESLARSIQAQGR